MKLFAYLLISVSVCIGAIAAATSYYVPIGLPDGAFNPEDGPLVLAAPAGAYHPDRSPDLHERVRELHGAIDARAEAAEPEPLLRREPLELGDLPTVPEAETAPTGSSIVHEREDLLPIARAGDPLLPEVLALIREANATAPPERVVEYVKVSSFSFARWPAWWAFALACVGLGVGAFIVKREQKRSLVAPTADASGAGAVESPDTALDRVDETVVGLLEDLPGLPDDAARNNLIVERLTTVQRDHVQAILDDRLALVGRLKMQGYAEFMDRFARMERQVNRAWSAAADGSLEEAHAALESAAAMMPAVREKLAPRV